MSNSRTIERSSSLGIFIVCLALFWMSLRLVEGTEATSATAGVEREPKMQLGVCDLSGLVNDLLKSDGFPRRLTDKRREWAALVEPFEAEVNRLRTEINARSGMNNPMIIERLTMLTAERMADNQKSAVRWDETQFSSGQVVDAYNRIRLVAATVAREQGINLLVQSSPNRDEDTVVIRDDTAWLVQDLMSRVLLVPDAATDITDQVRARLVALGLIVNESKPAATEERRSGP